MRQTCEKLDEKGMLYEVCTRFSGFDLGPETVSDRMMTDKMCIRDSHWLHDREGRLTVVPFCLREHIDDHLVRLPFGMIIVPVSYTHLDVYKRQGGHRADDVVHGHAAAKEHEGGHAHHLEGPGDVRKVRRVQLREARLGMARGHGFQHGLHLSLIHI